MIKIYKLKRRRINMVNDRNKFIKNTFFLNELERALKEINISLKDDTGEFKLATELIQEIGLNWAKINKKS
jgi:hypothetical protein